MRPSPRLLRFLVAWTVAGLLAAILPALAPLWWVFGVSLALMALLDLAFLPRAAQCQGERELPGRFALGVDGEVTLVCLHRLARPVKVLVTDGLPTAAQTESLPWAGHLPPGEVTRILYPVRFSRRGRQLFERMEWMVFSRFELWNRRLKLGSPGETRCYPNYEPVVRFALLATSNREDQMGIVKRRRSGATLDFHQLREYHDGDVLSRIDWKATSRRNQLISRDYEEQRNQTVLLVPDCGRRMRSMDGELSQFDHCLNAMLFLSYIALRQGDEVGVLGFGGTERWMKPVKGVQAMPKLLNHLYDYQTSSEPSDFVEAAERIMGLQKRRALVVLLTNLRSEDASHVIGAMKLLRQRHLVLVASLKEQELTEMARRPIETKTDALGYGALAGYFRERDHLKRSLESHRILTADETAQQLPISLANRYLDLKAGGQL